MSSEGKRIGEMGQLIKCREVKVERDLSAVRDKATSSEQLASVREMRCLKGLDLSQTVVELWSGEQGSLEVGMLRDWRALICFGSSEEVEVGVEGVGVLGVWVEVGAGEVEGVGAVGALVGEMVVALGAGLAVGEWTVEERVTEERRRRRRNMRLLRKKIGGFDAIFWKNDFLRQMSVMATV